MEEKILQKLDEQDKKIDALTKILNKIRKYFLAIFWVTIIMFVLPLLGAIFIIPAFLNNYLGSFEGLL